MSLVDGWHDAFNVPHDLVKGAVCLSGLYDIRPLCDIGINDWLRLTREQAAPLSPACLAPRAGSQLLLCVGGLETQGFKHQTLMMRDAWTKHGVSADLVDDSEHNHFNLVNTLADPASLLFERTMALIRGTASVRQSN